MDEKPTNDPAKDKIDWREHHSDQPYAAGKYSYEDYAPAYKTAHAAFEKHAGKEFNDIEEEIARDYEKHRIGSPLPWDEARDAVRAAWDRLGGVVSPRDPSRGIRSGL